MSRARDLADGNFSGDLEADSPTFVVDSANNRVGIGTTSPSTSLHVSTSADNVATFTSTDTGARIVITDSTDTGYVNVSSGKVSLGQTEGLSPNNLNIDASGNVGIGTSSLTNVLHVHQSDATSNSYVHITQADGGSGAVDGLSIGIEDGGVNAVIRNRENGYLRMYTNNVERMRINSSGEVLFGCTGIPNASRDGAGFSPNTFPGDHVELRFGSASTSSTNHVVFYNPNGIVGTIATSGSATAYNTSSDYRLKEDVQPMVGASNRVLALKPVNFAWKVDGSRVDGFLAHEAQEVVPEAVTGSKDAMRDEEYEVTPAVYDDEGNLVSEAVMGTRSVPNYQGIDQSKLVPLLTAALQEALQKIDALEARVATLEGGA